MIGLDTNVVVRLLTGDTPAEAARARALLSQERALLPVTVVLETEWVLRGVYDFPSHEVSAALRKLLQVGSIEVEDRANVLRALDWHDAGLDFADALHLATVGAWPGATGLATFDRKLAKRAARLANVPTVTGL